MHGDTMARNEYLVIEDMRHHSKYPRQISNEWIIIILFFVSYAIIVNSLNFEDCQIVINRDHVINIWRYENFATCATIILFE
jgi:hypothetical protein